MVAEQNQKCKGVTLLNTSPILSLSKVEPAFLFDGAQNYLWFKCNTKKIEEPVSEIWVITNK